MVTREQAAQELLARRQGRERLLSFTGYTFPQYTADPVHELIAGTLDRVVSGAITRLMIFAPPQHGKLIADNVPVLTTSGWKTHGEVRVGDYVIGRDGNPVRVIALSEKGIANREIEFTDGSIIQCHEKHEWVVFDRSKHRPEEITLEAQTMLDMGVWLGKQGKRGGRGRFQVDSNVCVSFPEAKLELDPYILGVWLGDGSTTKNCITHHVDDTAIVDRFEQLGFTRTSHIIHPVTGVHTSHFVKLYGKLKRLNLLGHKHIPDVYLHASVDQRLSLLAGLIDTDGCVYQQNGRITFSTTSKQLVQDVSRLIVSLGWRVTPSWFKPITSSSGVVGRKWVCQLSFNPTRAIPTVLNRKQTLNIKPAVRKRSIRAIREISPLPGQCIQVEGGVYLVGETLIPTHNSELTSVRLPGYWLGKRPDDPIILSSYAASLAEKHSREARQVVESQEYRALFGNLRTQDAPIETRRDSRAVHHWQVARPYRGGMLAVGVGGPITGHGARLGIIDDPFENWKQAQSLTYRNAVWDWYRTTFRTRIWEGGAIVLIMTRWHEDDLAGRLLKEQGDAWEVLRLPAIAESQEDRDKNNQFLGLPIGQPDPLGRMPGEPLAPSRFSKAALEALKKDVGSLAWAAEYQGVPRAPEGNRFKRVWFLGEHNERIVERVPQFARRVRYWDKAGTQDGGAYTAGVLLAEKDGLTYVEDAVRGQWSAYEREAKIQETAQMDALRYGSNFEVRIYVEQEPGSGGKESAENTVRALAGYVIEADPPVGNKDARLEPFAVQAEAGNIRLVRGDWNHDWIEEMVAIPNSEYRDQADATAGAFNKLHGDGSVGFFKAGTRWPGAQH